MQSDTLYTSQPRLPYILLSTAVVFALVLADGSVEAASPEYRAIVTYRVQTGDTFWLISENFSTSVAQLRRDNPHVNILEPGQVLYITTRVSGGTFPYRVRSGESLHRISERTQRSMSAIQRASSLKGTGIWAGQVLRIPVTDDNEYAEWVQPGDTLHRIATRHDVNTERLRALNPLVGDEIRINQILRIPHPGSVVSPPEHDSGSDILEYRVQPGDTLGAIVSRYGTTSEAVLQTNHLQSNFLMPGQLLYIPVGSSTAQSVEGPRGSREPGYGELLTWEQVRWYYPPGTDATVVDMYTGQRFSIRRLGGSNHADSEPITARDTAVMYELFGRTWTWASRPILLEVRGRTFAASMAGMPHDVQTIYDNDFNGHFCLYFYNSRSHNTNSIQSHHQSNVLRAAGLQ